MDEEWRPIVGWEGLYEVSSLGGVRRVGSGELTLANSDGYQVVTLSDSPRLRQVGVHRLVAEAFHPNPNNLPIARHLNDIRDDNRTGNIAWGTQKDNMLDAVRNGRNHETKKVSCPYGHPYDRVSIRGRRCSTCSDISREKSRRKHRSLELTLDSPIHGTRNGYNTYGCRCTECKKSNSDHQARVRNKKKENI